MKGIFFWKGTKRSLNEPKIERQNDEEGTEDTEEGEKDMNRSSKLTKLKGYKLYLC